MVTHHHHPAQTGPPREGPERRAEVRYTPTAHQALRDVQAGKVQYLDPGMLVVDGSAPDDPTYLALCALTFAGLVESAHEPDDTGLRAMGLTSDGADALSRWDLDHAVGRRAASGVLAGVLARNLLATDQTDAWVYAQGPWHGLPEDDHTSRGIGCRRWLPPAPEWTPRRTR